MDPIMLKKLIMLPIGLSYFSAMFMGIAYGIKTFFFKKYLTQESWLSALGIGFIGTAVFTVCGMLSILYQICTDELCVNFTLNKMYHLMRLTLIFATSLFTLSSLLELVILKLLFSYSLKELYKPIFFGNALTIVAVPAIRIVYFWLLPGAYIPFIDPLDDGTFN